MVLRRALSITGLVCVLSAQSAFGQQDPQFAQLPRTSDPFSLTPGTSFSASAKRPAGGKVSPGRAAISSDLGEALAVIARNHIDGSELSAEGLTGSAITSMLRTLDPHSNYFTPSEFQDLLGEHDSEYSGTGSSIAAFERNGRLEIYVVSTFADSPAARAGLRFGDRIVSVDGRSVSGEPPDAVRDMVRGRRGSIVRLTVERANTGRVETVEMKRDRVHEPAVPKGFFIKSGVGYIDLTNGFSNSTFGEFETALDDLKRGGMTSLVLDLRGNGGGILEQAVKVAEKFLPAGSTIVSQRGRYSDDIRVWKAGKPRHESMPLVLLVNESTASASEVLAGALQDNDRAIVVGQKTFGKGLVQNVLNLPEGAGLTLTAARYYTPAGRSIQRDYADTGLYDYYNHRTAAIDKPVYAVKTLTKRVVHGGDGITPDETIVTGELTSERARLLDPIFHFAREISAGRSVAGDDIRRIFDEFIGRDEAWANLGESARRERAFVTRMLGYYLAMAASGTAAADKARIQTDPQIQQAAAALPRSAQLAAAAQKQRSNPAKKEKSSLSLILNEPR